MSKLPARTINFEFNSNSYVIKYPDMGQEIDIESMRQQLSSNTYGAMLASRSRSSSQALDFIDMIATLSILIPTLQKDLRVKSLLELNALEAKQLLKAYSKQFIPWYSEWQALIHQEDPKDEDSEEEEEEDMSIPDAGQE